MPEVSQSSNSMAGATHEWSYQTRRKWVLVALVTWMYELIGTLRRVSHSLAYNIGKSFRRITHQTVPFGMVVDGAKVYLALRSANLQDVPKEWHVISTKR